MVVGGVGLRGALDTPNTKVAKLNKHLTFFLTKNYGNLMNRAKVKSDNMRLWKYYCLFMHDSMANLAMPKRGGGV